jgi:predicted ribosomally synthesized peptide with SipW-like signal peptide
MKTLLRAFVVMAVSLAALTAATSAYFTANVSATGQITTGTMTAYVGSWLTPTGNAQGQWVAHTSGGVLTQDGNFPAIINVAPGDTSHGYVVVANYGSLPFHYNGTATGAWTNGALTNSYMTVPQVHRYAANNCEADVFCEDIYYWLTNAGYTNVSAGADNFPGPVVGDTGVDSTNFRLSNMQFTIYRVDLVLNPAAGNEYQGQTFNYTLNVNANQLSQSF